MNLQTIDFKELEGFTVGNAQDDVAKTGVTALVFNKPNVCGIDISGGGPAARESFLFTPTAAQQSVTALLLSGGSAYGLAASTGAMAFLEEKDMGYHLGDLVVPIVPQSCIFDLGYGSSKVRPDFKMGYDACKNALEGNFPISGNIGGGTGGTAGKILGMRCATKTGIGYSAVKVGDFKIGAVVVVNALGDIYDHTTGQKIAGTLTPDRKSFADTAQLMVERQLKIQEGTNTTIGAVIMNGDFTQQQMCKIAQMTRSALGRSISPVGTSGDGDTVYAISTGGVKSDPNIAGVLACEVLSRAITDAVKSSAISDDEYLKFVR